MKNKFESFIERKKQEYGYRFDTSNLAKNFIPFYENGERIEVKFKYGKVKRGTVGVTTGWKPSFILMLTRRSIGSSYLLSDEDIINQN